MSFEQFPHNNTEKLGDTETQREIPPMPEAKEVRHGQKEVRQKPEQLEAKPKKIEASTLRPALNDQNEIAEKEVPQGQEPDEEKIKRYQKRHLPPHLRIKKGIATRFITSFLEKNVGFEKYGEDNIPEKGPFLVISNHFVGGDAESLLTTFKKFDFHLAIAKNMLWNKSPILRWLFKKMRMIPIEESLANLSEAMKEEAMHQQPNTYAQKVFREIIGREKQGGVATNVEFLHHAVAALSRGDVVGIFPEGLWLQPEGLGKSSRDKAGMKQGYRGLELVAHHYKKLTGQDLPIIPTVFFEDKNTGTKQRVVGKPLWLEHNDSKLNDTDWCMAHVARMLPEEERGYYEEMAREIKSVPKY